MTTPLAETGITGIEVRDAFFEKVNESAFKCRECGNQYKSAKGTTNLVVHASTHLGWLDKIKTAKAEGGAMNKYVHRMTSP